MVFAGCGLGDGEDAGTGRGLNRRVVERGKGGPCLL